MSFKKEATDKLNKYIPGTEQVFSSMEIHPPSDPALRKTFEQTLSLARQYLDDSKHYLGKDDLVTSLICIAYCEGIVDACRNLGWLKYKWPDEPSV
jgi:FAD synthetase